MQDGAKVTGGSEDDNREFRCRDFDRRLRGHPGGVYLHGGGAGAYLPIHPFADEPGLLATLGIRPGDCRSVDAWWRVGDDACFLQVWLSTDDPLGRRGLFARWSDGEPPFLNVVAVIDAPTVTRSAFEEAMADLVRLGVPGDARFGPGIGNRLTQVG